MVTFLGGEREGPEAGKKSWDPKNVIIPWSF
jgi:hypothetical protein